MSVCSFCLAEEEEEADFINVDHPQMIKFLCTEFKRDLVTRSCSRPKERPQPLPLVISLCSNCHPKYEDICKLHTLMVSVSRDIIKLLTEVRDMISKVDLERAQLMITIPRRNRPAILTTVEPEIEVVEPEVEAAPSNSGTDDTDGEEDADVVSPEIKAEDDEPYSVTFVSLEPHPVDLPINKNSASVFIDESESFEIEVKDEEPRALAAGELGWFDALDDQNNELLIKRRRAMVKDPLASFQFEPDSITSISVPEKKRGRPKKHNVQNKAQVNTAQKTLPNPFVSLVSVSHEISTRSNVKTPVAKSVLKCSKSFRPIADEVCPPSNLRSVKKRPKSWKGKKRIIMKVCSDCNESFRWGIQLFRHRMLCHKPGPAASQVRSAWSAQTPSNSTAGIDDKSTDSTSPKSAITISVPRSISAKPACSKIKKAVTVNTKERSDDIDDGESSQSDRDPLDSSSQTPAQPPPLKWLISNGVGYVSKSPPSTKYPCDKCKEVFSSTLDLRIHDNQKHKEGFKCSTCEHVVASMLAYEYHVFTKHHPPEVTTCIGCNVRYLRKCEFTDHFISHPNCSQHAVPCTATECRNKYFPTKEALRIHIEVRHSGPPPNVFSCTAPGCGKTFNVKQNLTDHNLHSHVGLTFPCDKCAKVYTTKANWKSHMKNVHGTRKYPCPICPMKFKNSNHLSRHKLLHGEEAPFLCSTCGKRYKVANQLNVHMWSHDPDRYEKYSLYSYKNNPKKGKPKTTRMKRKNPNVEDQEPNNSNAIAQKAAADMEVDDLQSQDSSSSDSGEATLSTTNQVSTQVLSLGDELRLDQPTFMKL